MAGKKRSGYGIPVVIALLCLIFLVFYLINADSSLSFSENMKNIWGDIPTERTDSSNSTAGGAFGDDASGKMLYYQIDVGNADSILIVAPTGETMLVDAGEDADYAKIAQVLYDNRVEQIDCLVMTHPHADHIGAMDEIIEDFNVQKFYVSNTPGDTTTYSNVINAAEDRGLDLTIAAAGMQDTLGGISIRFFNPIMDTYDDMNESSIVMLLTYGQTKFLLTGDIESASLADMVYAYSHALDCDVLKTAHHGSANATSREFLEAATPSIAVISCGADNSYGHPHAETLALLDEFGATVLRSDLNGDIRILSDGTNVTYATQK